MAIKIHSFSVYEGERLESYYFIYYSQAKNIQYKLLDTSVMNSGIYNVRIFITVIYYWLVFLPLDIEYQLLVLPYNLWYFNYVLLRNMKENELFP